MRFEIRVFFFFSGDFTLLSLASTTKRRIPSLFSFPFFPQHFETMLRAPQVTVRASSAALCSCSSSSRPALPARSNVQQRRRLSLSITRAGNATEEASKAAEAGVDECADNIGDYCTIDKAVRGWWKEGRGREREKESDETTNSLESISPRRRKKRASLRRASGIL